MNLVSDDFNLLSERAIVNRLLTDQSTIDALVETNIVEYLFHPEIKDIVAAACKLHSARQPIIKATLLEKIPNVNLDAYDAKVDGDILTHIDLIKQSHRVREAKRLFQEGIDTINKGNAGDVLESTITAINALGLDATNDNLKHIKFPFEEMLEQLRQAINCRNGIVGLPTGLKVLDKELGGLRKGELIVIAGRPGSGKTALAFEWAAYAASMGYGVAGFSLEMSNALLTMRIACSRTNISITDARNGKTTPDEMMRLESAQQEVNLWPLYMYDRPRASIHDIHKQIRRTKFELKRSGIDLGLVIIDYIQLMKGDDKIPREQQIAMITRELKSMSKEFVIPIVALAQLNRKVEERDDKRPMLSDLRESGAIEQDADQVLMIYRDDYYDVASKHKGVAEIIISKNRNGPTGTLYAAFDGIYTRFRDLTLAERAKAGLPGT